MGNRFCNSLASFALLVCAARTASATEGASLAEQEGVQAYREGRYEAALQKLQEAYRSNPDTALLLGIARTRYQLGELESAKTCLFDVLKADSKSANAAEAFDLLTRIEAAPQSSRGGKACLDRAPQKSRPAAFTKDLPPGLRKPAVEDAIRPRKHGPWSYSAMGAGVAAAGVATFFGLRNLSATSDWRAANTPAAIGDAHRRASSAATSANVAWVASTVFLAAGAGLFLFSEF